MLKPYAYKLGRHLLDKYVKPLPSENRLTARAMIADESLRYIELHCVINSPIISNIPLMNHPVSGEPLTQMRKPYDPYVQSMMNANNLKYAQVPFEATFDKSIILEEGRTARAMMKEGSFKKVVVDIGQLEKGESVRTGNRTTVTIPKIRRAHITTYATDILSMQNITNPRTVTAKMDQSSFQYFPVIVPVANSEQTYPEVCGVIKKSVAMPNTEYTTTTQNVGKKINIHVGPKGFFTDNEDERCHNIILQLVLASAIEKYIHPTDLPDNLYFTFFSAMPLSVKVEDFSYTIALYLAINNYASFQYATGAMLPVDIAAAYTNYVNALKGLAQGRKKENLDSIFTVDYVLTEAAQLTKKIKKNLTLPLIAPTSMNPKEINDYAVGARTITLRAKLLGRTPTVITIQSPLELDMVAERSNQAKIGTEDRATFIPSNLPITSLDIVDATSALADIPKIKKAYYSATYKDKNNEAEFDKIAADVTYAEKVGLPESITDAADMVQIAINKLMDRVSSKVVDYVTYTYKNDKCYIPLAYIIVRYINAPLSETNRGADMPGKIIAISNESPHVLTNLKNSMNNFGTLFLEPVDTKTMAIKWHILMLSTMAAGVAGWFGKVNDSWKDALVEFCVVTYPLVKDKEFISPVASVDFDKLKDTKLVEFKRIDPEIERKKKSYQNLASKRKAEEAMKKAAAEYQAEFKRNKTKKKVESESDPYNEDSNEEGEGEGGEEADDEDEKELMMMELTSGENYSLLRELTQRKHDGKLEPWEKDIVARFDELHEQDDVEGVYAYDNDYLGEVLESAKKEYEKKKEKKNAPKKEENS
jgi:hypothetical protein